MYAIQRMYGSLWPFSQYQKYLTLADIILILKKMNLYFELYFMFAELSNSYGLLCFIRLFPIGTFAKYQIFLCSYTHRKKTPNRKASHYYEISFNED